MKFMLFVLPTVPGTLEDRKRLRPIGRNNERYQQMLDELRKLAVFADDAGFDVMATTEHHFHSEGYETSVAPLLLYADLAARTKRIKFSPLGLGAAVVGSDARRRGDGGARPPDQGPHLRRLRPRLPGSLGQRARPAVPRDRRADGRLVDRQPQPQGLRGDAQGHQEGVDRGVLRLRRRVLQGAVSLQGGHHALAGARMDTDLRRARRGRRQGRHPQDLRRAQALPAAASAAVPALLGERIDDPLHRAVQHRAVDPGVQSARLPAPVPDLPGGGGRRRPQARPRRERRRLPRRPFRPHRSRGGRAAARRPTTPASTTTSAASASGRPSAPRRTPRSIRWIPTRRCRPRSGRSSACARSSTRSPARSTR